MSEAVKPDPFELIFALCHELRNTLAATRLQAHLLASDAAVGEVVDTGERISAMATRAGSLLAQVRPLLSPAGSSLRPIDPVDVLEEVRRSLDESCERSLRVELEKAAALPAASIDPESIHHLLLTAVLDALGALAPGQRARVTAEAAGDRIAFVVEDEGSREVEPSEPVMSGRALCWALAEAILERQGGQLCVQRRSGVTRVELWVPAVPPGSAS